MLQDGHLTTGARIRRPARHRRAVALFALLTVFAGVLAGCAGGGGGEAPAPSPPPAPPPSITSIAPSSGPLAGGMTVDITGANFGASTVAFGGTPATSVAVNEARTRITAGVPAMANAGPVDVTVTTNRGTATASRGFMYNAAPTITFLSPASGPVGGGNNLTVLGTSFEGEVTVLVGGQAATSVSVNAEKTQVTCVVPAGAAVSNVDVEVRCSLSGSARATGAYSYVNGSSGEAPAISSVTPTRGPTTGGTTMVIFGARFSGSIAVTIGGRAASGVRVNEARTQITCVTPASPSDGDVDVTVLSDRNGSATLADGFFYNPPVVLSGIAPSSGPQGGGTTVTISGASFEGRVTVTIGGRGATVVSVNGARTQLTARTPVSSSTGPKDVVVDSDSNGRATLPGAFTYNGPPPTLSSLSPNTGPNRGGTLLTILGTGFRGSMSVTLGGVPCTSVVVSSQTRLTCRTGAFSGVGAVDVVVASDTHGSVTAVGAFTYNANPAPTISAVTPDNGPQAGGNTVTVDGTNFLGAITLAFGTTPATSVAVASSTRLTAKVPAHAPGTVDLYLESDTHGGVTRTAAYRFNPTPVFGSVFPDRGPKFGDTPISVNGDNFFGAVTMTIGGVTAPISAVSADGRAIQARTPPSATTGAKTIVISSSTNGNVTATSAFTYEANPPPTVDSIDPDNGPISGGTIVTVRGTNFFGTVNVTVGGIGVGAVSVSGDHTQLTFSTPAVPTPGARDVVIGSSTHGVVTEPGAFTYNPPSTITTVTPNNGPLAGGTRVIIRGTNFGDTTSVRFGGLTGTDVIVNSPGEVEVTTPARTSPGAVDVQVISAENGTVTKANGYTYNPAATLTLATPNNGPLVGGNVVRLTGTNFGGGIDVTFGGTATTGNVSFTATEITCVAPARGTAGPVDVRIVSSTNGPATLASGYTYNPSATIVTPLVPADGPLAGGTTVNITGTNLGGTVNVTIGGKTATDVVRVSATSIRARTPPGDDPGPVDVEIFSSTNGPARAPGAFTYNPAPVILGVAPISGPQAGGTPLTIDGNFFFGTVNVTIGSAPCTNVVVNPFRTQITCVTGASPDYGLKDLIVSSSTHGTTTDTGAFTYIPPLPLIASVTPDQGGIAGGTPVTIEGQNFENTINVTFGASSASETVRVSSTRITCKTPPGPAVGPVTVFVGSSSHGVGSRANGFTYNPTMTITSIVPPEGPFASTTNVLINGTNFLGQISVTVGGAPATSVVVNSSTQIACTVPSAGGPGTVPLKVISTTFGEATSNFTYNAAPSVGSLVPPSGPTAGGTDVDINGSGFGGTITVKIGDTFSTAPVAQFISVNPERTLIKIKTPANSAGPKNVFVLSSTNGQGTRAAGFTYNSPPAATNITPNEGPLAGGTDVLINGSGFTGTVTVDIGGNPATIISVTTNQIRALTPTSTTTGTKDVFINATGGGSTTLPAAFTYNPLPTISLPVSPTSGPQDGGQLLTIDGTGFRGTVNVTVCGVPATNVVANLTGTQVTCRTGASTSAPLTGDVQVGSSTHGVRIATNAYTYNPRPTIATIVPDNGPQAGGQLVTVTGTNFGGTITAEIGGNAMTGIAVQSATQFTGRTPPSTSTGAKNLTVHSTSNGDATRTNAYTYNFSPVITGLTPDNGPLDGGNTVTISGQSFDGTVNVSFGSTPAVVTNVNAAKTQITVIAPAGTAAGPVTVTVSASLTGQATATYTYNPRMTISSVSPNNGPTIGGTSIILTGTNFENITQVRVDSASVTFTRNSATQITAVTPPRPGAPGAVDVEVFSTTHGTAIRAGGFTYNPETKIFNIVPNEGPLAGGNVVDIRGAGYATPLTVTFGGVAATTLNVTPQGIQVRPPARATPGTVDVKVDSQPNGPFTVVNGYTYNTTPTGITIAPDNGPKGGGNTVIITGNGFGGTVTVTFGTRNGTVTNVTPDRTQVTAIVPPSAAEGAVDVGVNATATGSVTKTGGYTYNPPLSVTSITPNQGPQDGGTVLTINGANLLGPLTITVGPVDALGVTQVVTGTQIKCTTATSPVTGTFNVTVSSTTHGTSITANAFTYNTTLNATAIAPDNGPIGGGTTVNITGTGMFGVTDVTFGGQSAQAGSVSVNVSGTVVTARTPAGITAGPKDVVVISPTHGRDTLPNAFTYNPEFTAGAPVATGTAPRALVTDDMNGDGKQDVVVANQVDDTVMVFLNNTAPVAAPSFTNTGNVSFTVGDDPTGLATADIDGDKRPDILVANKLSNTVSILLNQTVPGTTTSLYAPDFQVFMGGGPSAVVASDFNGDGRLDIASTGELAPFIRVRSNFSTPGVISLGNALSFGCGNGPTTLVAADFNNDGKPDLATSNKDDSTVSVLRNNTVTQDANVITGTVASFVAATTLSLPAGSSTQGITAADYDGDGKLDIAVANAVGANVTVFLNTTPNAAALPSFSSPVSFPAAGTPPAIISGDLDRDGRMDIVTANDSGNSVSFRLSTTVPNSGTPTFAGRADLAAGTSPRTIGVADFNGDARLDIITANRLSNTFQVFQHVTALGVTPPAFSQNDRKDVAVGTSPVSVILVDVDRDGRLDPVVANDGSANYTILANDTTPGANTFTLRPAVNGAAGANPSAVASLDIDGEGRPDFVIANRIGQSLTATLNNTDLSNRTIQFGASSTTNLGIRAAGLAVADVSLDGRPDVAVTSGNSSFVFLLRNTTTLNGGTPQWSITAATTGAGPRGVALGDLNGDGRPDLVTANSSSDTITVIMNNTVPGSNSVSFPNGSRADFATDLTPAFLALLDYNGDGKLDIAVANQGASNISVFRNATPPGSLTPVFTDRREFLTAAGPVGIAAVDFNGDGILDLAVGASGADKATILINETVPADNAVPNFADRVDLPVGARPQGVAAADLNGDGRTDGAAAALGANVVTLIRNFTTP